MVLREEVAGEAGQGGPSGLEGVVWVSAQVRERKRERERERTRNNYREREERGVERIKDK